jgi:hypothetical protein
VRAATLLLAAALGACSLFDADIPSRSCARDNDCFVAQGESCYLATGQCGPRPDAAPPDADLPDADLPDADDSDGGEVDADLADADESDAPAGAP